MIDGRVNWRRWLWLVFWVALCFAAAGIGSAFTTPRVGNWYAQLNKPSFTPPSWVFGPVWTVLYAMMGVAAWLVWDKRHTRRVTTAVAVFLVHLLINTSWSVVFFGLRQPGWAVLNIAALWLAIAATLALFWRHSRGASLLLVPYLLWVSYAAALNVAIWRMN